MPTPYPLADVRSLCASRAEGGLSRASPAPMTCTTTTTGAGGRGKDGGYPYFFPMTNAERPSVDNRLRPVLGCAPFHCRR